MTGGGASRSSGSMAAPPPPPPASSSTAAAADTAASAIAAGRQRVAVGHCQRVLEGAGCLEHSDDFLLAAAGIHVAPQPPGGQRCHAAKVMTVHLQAGSG